MDLYIVTELMYIRHSGNKPSPVMNSTMTYPLSNISNLLTS